MASRTLSINLLKNRHTLSEKDYQRESDIFRYTLIAFVVIVVLSLSGVAWQVIQAARLSRTESRIAVANKQLAGYAEANAQQLYLKSRLKLITSFLDERSVERVALQKLFSINIPGVLVSSVSFASQNVVNTQFTADDVLVLEELLKYLKEDLGFFTQIVSSGIARNGEDGTYSMSVVLTTPRGE